MSFLGSEKFIFLFFLFFRGSQPNAGPNSARSLLFAKTHLFAFYSAVERCQRKRARADAMRDAGEEEEEVEGEGFLFDAPLTPPPPQASSFSGSAEPTAFNWFVFIPSAAPSLIHVHESHRH